MRVVRWLAALLIFAICFASYLLGHLQGCGSQTPVIPWFPKINTPDPSVGASHRESHQGKSLRNWHSDAPHDRVSPRGLYLANNGTSDRRRSGLPGDGLVTKTSQRHDPPHRRRQRFIPGFGPGGGAGAPPADADPEDLEDPRKSLKIEVVPDYDNAQNREHRECSQKKKGPEHEHWQAESICGVHHVANDFVRYAPMNTSGAQCVQWIVYSLRSEELGQVPAPPLGWCCVAAVDSNVPAGDHVCTILDPSAQNTLGLSITALVQRIKRAERRRQALKNVALLFAMQQGAEVIAEADPEAVRNIDTIPVLPEWNMMAGEEDTTAALINPWKRYQSEPPCGVALRAAQAEPYYVFHDGGGVRALSVQQPVYTNTLSPQSPCMCRCSWNKFHSSCRKRFKKCSIFSHNHPVVPRRNESLAAAAFGSRLTVYTRRAFWALLVPRTGDLLLRSLWMQRLLWSTYSTPVFYNLTTYTNLTASYPTNIHSEVCSEAQPTATAMPEFAALLVAAAAPGETVFAVMDALAANLPRSVPGITTKEDLEWQAAWQSDLQRVGYKPPAVYQPEIRLGAIVTLLDESERDIMKFIWFWFNFRFARKYQYPFWMFYIDGTLEEQERKAITERVPGFEVRFIPVQYNVPMRFWGSYESWASNGTKGYGYIYCSQFLGYEMFRHPLFEGLQYYMRVDEDTHTPKKAPIVFDPFQYMQAQGLRFATPQIGIHSSERDQSVSAAMWRFVQQRMQGTVQDTWIRAQAYFAKDNIGAWDRWIYAGCIELAAVALYRDPRYREYLWEVDWLRGVFLQGWLEQAIKTTWPLVSAPPAQWHYMCELVVFHRYSLTGYRCGQPYSLRPVIEMLNPPVDPVRCFVRYFGSTQKTLDNPQYRALGLCDRPQAQLKHEPALFRRHFRFEEACCVRHLYQRYGACCALSGDMEHCMSLGVCLESDPNQDTRERGI